MSYQEAVEFVTRFHSAYVSGAPKGQRVEAGQVLVALSLGVYYVQAEGDNPGRYNCSNEAAEILLSRCEQDPGVFQLCRDISATCLLIGASLPPALRIFSACFLAGQLIEPKKTRRSQSWLQNQVRFALAKEVEERFGLALTRNDEKKGSVKDSACDAVAEGLSIAGKHVAYGAIKDICVSSKVGPVSIRDEHWQWRRSVRNLTSIDPNARRQFPPPP